MSAIGHAAHPSAGTQPGLQRAFQAWCSHQRQVGHLRRETSISVYQSMWQALAVWCTAQAPPLRLQDLQAPALTAYLASRSGLLLADGVLTPRYQRRLLGLVQRVQAHQAWQRHSALPVARHVLTAALVQGPAAAPRRLATADGDALQAGSIDRAEPLLYLLPAEYQHLQRALCSPNATATTAAAATADTRWQARRNRCAMALQLGAGLGPGELRALRLTDVQAGDAPDATKAGARPWQLRVTASGSAAAHQAPLAPWAAELLKQWLQLRQVEALGGDWLLPSTRSGKPWGKVAQYGAAQGVLAEAGLGQRGGGSFLLRHSFALRQLHHGVDEAQLSHWLGVADAGVMARYRIVLAAWPAPEPIDPPDAAGGRPAAPGQMLPV